MPGYKEQEIENWYNKYSASIFKYILMMIQEYYQAEDLTQETFVKAYMNLHTFEHDSSAKTWLYRIAHNVTIDHIRKQRPIMLFKEIFPGRQSEDPLPEDQMILKEDTKELYEALGELKPSYREVIILRRVKEFSTKETMEILGWSESKVKMTLVRAMKALEKKLSKEGTLSERII